MFYKIYFKGIIILKVYMFKKIIKKLKRIYVYKFAFYFGRGVINSMGSRLKEVIKKNGDHTSY